METDHLCRICLENGAKFPLFENSKSEDCDILNKLFLCLKEKIKDIEGYPRYLCINCYNTIETTYSFINKFRQTSDFLAKSVKALKGGDYLNNPQLEVVVDICNIKNEPDFDETFFKASDNLDESLPLINFKLKSKIKEEKAAKNAKRKNRKKLTIKSKSTKKDINRIASSILEGEFAWIGDVWCIKSTKPGPVCIEQQKPVLSGIKSTKPRPVYIEEQKAVTAGIESPIPGPVYIEEQKAVTTGIESTEPGPVCIEKQKVGKDTPEEIDLSLLFRKPKKPTQPSPPRLCDLCGEIFKDQDKLSIHKRKVHFKQDVPTKCPHCPRVLVSKYYLNRHLKRRHDTQGKNFMCQTCGRAFAFKGELTTHITNVHNKHLKPKKVYTCKICNKNYKCAKSVLVHERSVHTGLRPAICEVCGTSFFHEDYLREHMRLHTGETPFKCPICGRGYAQRCNMKSHLRIHRISDLDATTLSKLRPNYLKLLKMA